MPKDVKKAERQLTTIVTTFLAKHGKRCYGEVGVEIFRSVKEKNKMSKRKTERKTDPHFDKIMDLVEDHTNEIRAIFQESGDYEKPNKLSQMLAKVQKSANEYRQALIRLRQTFKDESE
jgi:tRNA-dihydrouridine synthase